MQLERRAWSGPDAPVEARLRSQLEREGFSVFRWSDGPAATYSPHAHDHDESIWVVAGEITFGTAGGELRLGPGDRLMLPRGSVHTATAGADGATYLIGER
jgi:quercetin dioxygenase-like cupin family protein